MKGIGPLVIYFRKSRFTGKGESIENQIEMCRQSIRLQFVEEAADSVLVYEDEEFSGGNLEHPRRQGSESFKPLLFTGWTGSAATSAILRS